LLPRDDRPVPKILGPLCEHPGVECVPAVGQGELIDVLPNVSKVPVATLRAITAWFDRVMGRSRQPIRVVTKTDTRVPVARSAAVRESVQRLGAAGIFAIVTDEPEQVHGATVVLLNAGVIPHTGPARLWVTLARQLATRGVRVVRLDLSGVGESPAREGQTPHLAHPIEAMDDLSMVLDGLGVDAEDAVIAGLCSGAYHAIEAGLRMPLRGVCAINPILSFDPPEVKAGEKLARERQAVAPFNGPIKRLRRISGLAAWGEHRAPPMLWWLLDKTGVQAHPGHGFEELARRGIPVALLCGEVEARPFLRRARWSFEALLRSGALTWDLLRHDDHNLFGADAREHAHGLILDRLTDLATTRTDVSVSASRAADKTNLVSSLHTA
jgi:pimeloyl-ACP methyl ester carboxylesterase